MDVSHSNARARAKFRVSVRHDSLARDAGSPSQAPGRPAERAPDAPRARSTQADHAVAVGRRLAVPADRRLRLPLGLPHRGAGRARRLDRVAVPAPLRRRRASSGRCSTAAPARSAWPPTASRSRPARRYDPGTNVLETTWMTPTGWLVVRDALTIGDWHGSERAADHTRPPTDHDADHLLVRVVECVQGEVPVELVCAPRFDYGRAPARWTPSAEAPDQVLDATDGKTTRAALQRHADGRRGLHRARATHDARGRAALLRALLHRGARRAADLRARRTAHIWRTCHFWREWLAAGTYPDHPWREYLQRSALVLKGLTYAPTGAMIAALTTSLPETPGRASATGTTATAGCATRPSRSGACTRSTSTGRPTTSWSTSPTSARNKDGSLQIMYGIGGERNLKETTLRHLKGYLGSRPVRKGNGAYNQRQNDVFGAVLDSVYLHTKRHDHIHDRLWPVLCDQVAGASRVWREPDQGIWEARGEPRHYVSSKLMCWVALDRGARLAELRGEPELAVRWQATADEIREDILTPRRRRARRLRPALRHHRARRLLPADPARALPAERRRARARDGARDRRRAERPRADPPLPRRGDRRRSARRGGHVPDLLVLDGLRALGDRRARAGPRALRAAARARVAARRSTPRSSTRAAAAISATSRRRSRTWR